MKDIYQISLKVVGDHTMHCAGCERSIELTLGLFPEINNVNANWENQSIEIDLADSSLETDKIKQSLSLIGYEVEIT